MSLPFASPAVPPTWTLPLASPDAALPLVGGKGANLARLAAAGLPVPPGFLVTTHAYRTFVDANALGWRIEEALGAATSGADTAQFEATSARIRALFAGGAMPTALAGALLAAYAALGRPPVAVRSSATAEDLPEMSFAGQQDTYLNVVGGEALLQAVIACWSSLWTARAIAYRARNAVPHAGAALAVVVQEMVESQASGVLFTANPLTGLRTETVIDATVGLGEALVSGQVEPDHYVVDTASGQIMTRTLGAKATSVRSRAGGGTTVVAESGGREQALPDEQIRDLATLGRRVAGLHGSPQDIEWAWAGGSLYLLQARPITSLYPLPAGLPPEPLMVLLSFNAMQGVLAPLTPLGQDMVRQIIAAAASLFGIHVTRETQRAIFVAGERLWMNATPLMRNKIGRRLLPGIASFLDPSLKPAIAALMADPRLLPGRQMLSGHSVAHLARGLLPLAGRVILNLAAPDARRRAIVQNGERLLARARAGCAAIEGTPREELAQLAAFIPDLVARSLPNAFAVFVSGVASGMASFNLLRSLAGSLDRDSGGDTDASWRERSLEITRALPNNPTTRMDLELWQVSQQIRRDPAALAAIQGQSAAQLAASYQANALPEVAQSAFDRFLAAYGARGLAEIDLGRERWAEAPAPVMDVVTGYLQIEDPTRAPDAVFARHLAAAGVITDQLLAAAAKSRRGWLKTRAIRFAAGRARTLMSMRESPKFMIVRVFAIFRTKLLATGRGLTAAGELQEPEDLFYLTFNELAAFAREENPGDPGAWPALVAQRRDVYRRELLRRQIPRLMLSDGRAVYAGLPAPAGAEGLIMGGPVSPGSVEGRVRIVLDPRQAGLLPGEILVCPGTDPAWTPLFLTAGGLIMEVGGLMTHGAVVAREYGIPAVVGVDRATQRLHTGQRIQLNGSTGEIRLLD